MTRGNQRDRDRERAQNRAKSGPQKADENKGRHTTVMESNADKMREKQRLHDEKVAAAAAAAASGGKK